METFTREELKKQFINNNWNSIVVEAGYDTLTIEPCSQMVNIITKEEDVEFFLIYGAPFDAGGDDTLDGIVKILNEYPVTVAKVATYKKEFPKKIAALYAKYNFDETNEEFRYEKELMCDEFRSYLGYYPRILRVTTTHFVIYDYEGMFISEYKNTSEV